MSLTRTAQRRILVTHRAVTGPVGGVLGDWWVRGGRPLPFDEIAPLVSRTPEAARQLASRARRRVRGVDLPSPDQDPTRQRQVVEAFYAAANAGDFDALVELLHPDVVFRADYGPSRPAAQYRGGATVAKQAGRARGADLYPVLVNGLPGVITVRNGRPVSIMAFTVVDGLIVEIDGLRDPHRVRQLASCVIRQDHD